MNNIPDKCSRCGAPIDWEKGESSTKCGYCGKINYPKNDYLNSKFNREISKWIDQIYLTSRLVLRNKYSKVLFLSSIILVLGSIINKFINDPVKVYKAKIEEVCTRTAFYEKKEASQNKNLVDCKNYMRNSIIILDKVSSKLLNESKSDKLIKKERIKASINDEYQYIPYLNWSSDDIAIKFRTIPGDFRGEINYEIPLKYKLNRIKIECKKIKPLQKAIYSWITEKNKAIKIEKEKISSRNLNNTDTNGYPSLFRFQSKYDWDLEKINHKNWYSRLREKTIFSNAHYNTPNEIDKVKKIIRNNSLLSDLEFTKPINKSNFINKNQCIENLTNRFKENRNNF